MFRAMPSTFRRYAARAAAAIALGAGAALAAGCRPAAARRAPDGPFMVGLRAKSQSFTRTGVRYEVLGAGLPVVLVHPTGTDARIWDAQVAAFASHFLVITYDRPGHGRSRGAAPGTGAHEELRALLDELRVPRAAIVGLSSGAAVALDFALAYPGRATQLVLASPALDGWVPQERPAWRAALDAAVRDGDDALAARRFADSPAMAVPNDTAAAARLRTIVFDNTRVWRDAVAPRPLAPSAYGRLAELAAPTLILVGGADAADVHLVADRILHGAPDARRVVIDSVGHMVSLAAPAAFGAAVLGFLQEP